MRCFAIILLCVLSGCSKAKYDDHVILPNAYPVAVSDDCHLFVARDAKQNDQFYFVFDALDATKMSIKPFTAKVGNCLEAACREDGQRVYFVYTPAMVNDRLVIDEYEVASGNQTNSWTLETKYACGCHTVLAPFHHDQLAISFNITCIGDDVSYVPETTFFHFDTSTGKVMKRLDLNYLIVDMQVVPSHSRLYATLLEPNKEKSWLEAYDLQDGQFRIEHPKQIPLRKELMGKKRIYLDKSSNDQYVSACDKYSDKNIPYTSMLIRTADNFTADVIENGVPIWPAHKSDEVWIHERSNLTADAINPDLTQKATQVQAFGGMSDAIILFSNEESVIALRPKKSDVRDIIARRRKESD